MQILKGTLLGVGIFLVFSVIYFLFGLRYQLGIPKGTHFAIGMSAIKVLTLYNPLFWVAFAASLVVGCVLVRFLSRN